MPISPDVLQRITAMNPQRVKNIVSYIWDQMARVGDKDYIIGKVAGEYSVDRELAGAFFMIAERDCKRFTRPFAHGYGSCNDGAHSSNYSSSSSKGSSYFYQDMTPAYQMTTFVDKAGSVFVYVLMFLIPVFFICFLFAFMNGNDSSSYAEKPAAKTRIYSDAGLMSYNESLMSDKIQKINFQSPVSSVSETLNRVRICEPVKIAWPRIRTQAVNPGYKDVKRHYLYAKIMEEPLRIDYLQIGDFDLPSRLSELPD